MRSGGLIHPVRIDVAGHGSFGWGAKKSASVNTPQQQVATKPQDPELKASAFSEWQDEPVTVQTDAVNEAPEKRKGLLGRLLDKAF